MSFGDRGEARRTANSAYRRSEVIEGRKAVIATFTETLKLYAAFNAGGLIALLGFLGAVAGKAPRVLDDVTLLIHPMLWFGAGLATTGVAGISYYLTRLNYVEEYMRVSDDIGHTPDALHFMRKGMFLQRLSTVFAIASFILFIIGILACLPLIRSIKL
jgi:hypothetical protein